MTGSGCIELDEIYPVIASNKVAAELEADHGNKISPYSLTSTPTAANYELKGEII